MTELRICVDARLVSGHLGGVEQTIIGLAYGLSQLEDGNEVYHFLVHEGTADWLVPYLHGRCRPMYVSANVTGRAWSGWLGRMRFQARRGWHTVAPLLGPKAVEIQMSDGVIERAGIEVMHFASPVAFRTEVPSLYQFFDIQHRVLPDNFTSYERMARDVQYQAFIDQATVVSAMTSRGRRDLLTDYDVPPEKVIVVPFGPALSAYASTSSAKSDAIACRLNLPNRYVFYPAQTWKHKNHIALLHALAFLRSEAGIVIPLICSGRRNEFFPAIQRTIKTLDLDGQVRFVGFVTPEELQVLYQRCQAVVFPSSYEGFGMPVLEAFQCGRPLACANIPLLADIVGDAAVLFDPAQPGEIAEAIRQIWFDIDLQKTLSERGRIRVTQFDWVRTARVFRAHHRRIAGRPLSDNDCYLLDSTPIL